MGGNLRAILRSAAAVPDRAPDLDRLLVLARRHRRRRRVAATAASFVLVAVATAVAIPLLRPNPGVVPNPAAPTSLGRPISFEALPDGWTELPAPSHVRHYGATAWTGTQLLMWAGTVPEYSSVSEASGFALDTRTGLWQDMPSAPLAGRIHPAHAWTGTELLVWGGRSAGQPRTEWFADGAAYNPQTGVWRMLPPAPISARAPMFAWTGRELVVWGTVERGLQTPPDGAAYDPAADSWRPIAAAPVELTDATAVWTGREIIVVGASLSPSDNAPATPTAIAAAYNPSTNAWRTLPHPDLSPQAATAAWNGAEVIAVDYQGPAAAYDPVTDAWRQLPDLPLSPGECLPQSVAIGRAVVVHLCRGMVLNGVAGDGWDDVTNPAYRGWWVELVAADPIVVLLGKKVPGNAEVVLAFRPQA